MKKVFVLALALVTLTAGAQTFPAPSPAAKTYQVVGVAEFQIDYSSPAVRGRQIFGELVPYGELWRTGANSATTLSSSEDFSIDGKEIKAGKYSIFTIPADDAISVVINSNAEASTGEYSSDLDVLRIAIPFKLSKIETERMQFTFENTTTDQTELTFRWADRMFALPIMVATDKIVEKRAEAKMASGDVDFNFFNSAANYYLETGNNKKALEMAKKSVEMNAKFYNTYTLAKAYQINDDKKSAKEAAQKSLKLAQDAKYDHYIMLNQNLLKEL